MGVEKLECTKEVEEKNRDADDGKTSPFDGSKAYKNLAGTLLENRASCHRF